MGGNASVRVLSQATERELFHLQNGLNLSSVRDLAINLREMDDGVFSHHVREGHNDFATWVRDVFGDEELAADLESSSSRDEMADSIESHLLELEEKELIRFGVHLPNAKLESLERYIEDQLEKGRSLKDVRNALLAKKWNDRAIDLVLASSKSPLRKVESLDDIESVERFHGELEGMKRMVINAVAHGSTIEQVRSLLTKQGWQQQIIDFIFYDIFKPHPNIKKLSNYIIHQVKDKNKDVEKVKKTLMRLGWKGYLIDSVMFGINTPDNSLDRILSYLEEFSPDNQDQVKEFLLKMGWNDIDVNAALERKELESVEKELIASYNIEDGDVVKRSAKVISSSIIQLSQRKEVKPIIHRMMKAARKVPLNSFRETHGELHLDDEYSFYFDGADISKVKSLDGGDLDLYFLTQKKPLLLDGKRQYLVLPKGIKRACVICGKRFPVSRLHRVEMWDASRTHKITKFVCPRHEKQLRNFLEETRIVQS